MEGTESRESSGQEEGVENGDSWLSKGAIAAGAIAGLAAVALGVAGLLSGSTSSGGQRKTMKAPGQNKTIDRDDFESDPKSYFKSLRK